MYMWIDTCLAYQYVDMTTVYRNKQDRASAQPPLPNAHRTVPYMAGMVDLSTPRAVKVISYKHLTRFRWILTFLQFMVFQFQTYNKKPYLPGK